VLDHALEYASRGWRVFPVNGKIPITPHGVLDATMDLVTVTGMWTSTPRAGIGLATGSLVVLDIDPKNDGDESLFQMEKKYGKLPDTLRSITGSGGTHYFFLPTKEVRNGTNILGYSGIDIRGTGGYVVLPPSPHESGRNYCWDIGSPNVIANIPDYLSERKVDAPTSQAEEFWGNGIRNDRLSRLAGSLRARGFDFDPIYRILLLANSEKCRPALADAEVYNIARSIARYPGGVIGTTDSTRRGAGSSGEDSPDGRGRLDGTRLPTPGALRKQGRKASIRTGPWYLGRGR